MHSSGGEHRAQCTRSGRTTRHGVVEQPDMCENGRNIASFVDMRGKRNSKEIVLSSSGCRSALHRQDQLRRSFCWPDVVE